MLKVKLNDKMFMKDMNNIIQYAEGFLDGVNKGKTEFLKSIGESTIEQLKNYIDTNARVNPAALHHVYEWSQTGSPSARLFDINYTISNLGLSIKSTFSQSRSIKAGSDVPFYSKAKIMENGIPVTIRPKKAKALRFEENGEEVFSRTPITVTNPGGPEVSGAYEKVFDSFFTNYFSQAFLNSSGIFNYLKKPEVFKNNLEAGKRGGRSVGITTGYRWIANAGKVS
jgi:hypothetical protein